MDIDISTLSSPEEFYHALRYLLDFHVDSIDDRKKIMGVIVKYCEACKANVPVDRLLPYQIKDYEYRIDNLQNLNKRYVNIFKEMRKIMEKRERQIFFEIGSLINVFNDRYKE